jgi:ABC-2 type transport system permease protein
MLEFSRTRWRAMFVREIIENKVSLFWAPVAIALAISLLLFISVLASSRSAFFSDLLLPALLETSGQNSNINITIDGDNTAFTLEQQETYNAEQLTEPTVLAPDQAQDKLQTLMRENNVRLDPVFNALHSLLMLVLVVVSVNYLLASLHTDRRDRSVLFWRSMPVSESEEVLSKLATALLIAPAIYIGASLFAQLLLLLNMMLLVMHWDMDPFTIVLANIDGNGLLVTQLFGFLRGTVSLLPLYAWLLFASAAARRSPFMTALAPVVVLVLLERFTLGSDVLGGAVWARLPGYAQGTGLSDLLLPGGGLPLVSVIGLLAGLAVAAVLLVATVYLRRYRFES